MSASKSEPPDSDAAHELYRRAAKTYDRRLALTSIYRRRAVDALELQPGDRVPDVACGTGANFHTIERAIGLSGNLVGVDLSSHMLAIADERVRANRWENVELIESAVEDARLSGEFDGVLFSLTHDVLQSDSALAAVFARARTGTRVASFGVKWAPSRLAPVNLVARAIARRYVTTFDGMDAPWRKLERFSGPLRIDGVLLGACYVARGRFEGR